MWQSFLVLSLREVQTVHPLETFEPYPLWFGKRWSCLGHWRRRLIEYWGIGLGILAISWMLWSSKPIDKQEEDKLGDSWDNYGFEDTELQSPLDGLKSPRPSPKWNGITWSSWLKPESILTEEGWDIGCERESFLFTSASRCCWPLPGPLTFICYKTNIKCIVRCTHPSFLLIIHDPWMEDKRLD